MKFDKPLQKIYENINNGGASLTRDALYPEDHLYDETLNYMQDTNMFENQGSFTPADRKKIEELYQFSLYIRDICYLHLKNVMGNR